MEQDQLKEFRALVDITDFDQRYAQDITVDTFFGFPLAAIIEAEKKLHAPEIQSVAYLSMEFGLATSFYNCFIKKEDTGKQNRIINHEIFSNMRIEDFLFGFQRTEILDLPIYSGGLGVLAGDTLKSSADLGIPMAAFGILWEKGYFKQNFWFKYGQVPEAMNWEPLSYPGLIPLSNKVTIKFNKDTVVIRLWKYYVYSHDKKNVVPLILLDTNVPENPDYIKALTDQLYRSSDNWIRFMQRSILGIGAIKALDQLGYRVHRYHLNEGHAAMAFVERAKSLSDAELTELRKIFVYTCHTPVAAGHDRFPARELEKILPQTEFNFLKKFGREDGSDQINLTRLLLTNCDNINTVAKKHRYVTTVQFPEFKDKIRSVTNGVHTSTWLSQSVGQVFDAYSGMIGDYKNNPVCLENILKLKDNKQFRLELWQAHQENKKRLASLFAHWRLKENVFTICWARRIAQYKRPALLFQDTQRLLSLAKTIGPIQIIIAGKAHPADNLAGKYIDQIMAAVDSFHNDFDDLRVMILENYDIYFGKLLTSCVDVWLNNPLPPFEASGTSGMKAILNGVVQLSTLDGWVVEVKNTIGEIFGYRHNEGDPIGSEGDLRLEEDSGALYASLERLMRLYYQLYTHGTINVDSQWIDMMINCIAESSFFNTHRMVQEYKEKMWKI